MFVINHSEVNVKGDERKRGVGGEDFIVSQSSSRFQRVCPGLSALELSGDRQMSVFFILIFFNPWPASLSYI